MLISTALMRKPEEWMDGREGREGEVKEERGREGGEEVY